MQIYYTKAWYMYSCAPSDIFFYDSFDFFSQPPDLQPDT